VCGCTQVIDVTRVENLSPNEGIAFGRINVRVNEQDKNWGPSGSVQQIKWQFAHGKYKFKLFLQSKTTNDLMISQLFEDGSFIWQLPYGQYEILSFEWRWYEPLVEKWQTGQINAQFQLSPTCTICYLGTIIIDVDQEPFTRYKFQVLDEETEATRKLEQISTGLHNNIGKQLVQVEQPL